jgi:rod shape determining protein RodA
MALEFLGLSKGDGVNSFGGKLARFDWTLLFLVGIIAGFGTVLLFGAAGGHWAPWAFNHLSRYFLCAGIMIAVSVIDIRFWYNLAYPAYVISFILIVAVDLFGHTALGAQRWIALGPIKIQPSEFMKISVILALARYYQDLAIKNFGPLKYHIIPILMTLVPAGLIMKQPDLGTGSTVAMIGAVMIFLSGIYWRYILGAIMGAISAFILAYNFVFHEFQRNRILTFLNPEADKLGKGYQITQSKIAIGSGGFWGSGYMNGTQSQLDFLPERHTDFVFAMLLEEFGMAGGLFALLLYFTIMAIGLHIARSTRHLYGKMVAGGITMLLFIYVSINAAMIMGLVPVVGMPMPFLSYGGSVMLSVMFALGLVQNVKVHRDKIIHTGFKSQ